MKSVLGKKVDELKYNQCECLQLAASKHLYQVDDSTGMFLHNHQNPRIFIIPSGKSLLMQLSTLDWMINQLWHYNRTEFQKHQSKVHNDAWHYSSVNRLFN